MATIYLAFGSNLGNRKHFILQALEELRHARIQIKKVSAIMETEPQGGPQGQRRYLNCVALAQTELSPSALLSVTQQIETDLGRIRNDPNGPRTIDIDILLYDQVQMKTNQLIIPHPRMKDRDFVMTPLRQIDPVLADTISHARI